MYLLLEELVSSGLSSLYLMELPYNLHLCSQNESNLSEFRKSKTIWSLGVWVYMGEWVPPSPSFPSGMHMSLTCPPLLVLWGPNPWFLALQAVEGTMSLPASCGKPSLSY